MNRETQSVAISWPGNESQLSNRAQLTVTQTIQRFIAFHKSIPMYLVTQKLAEAMKPRNYINILKILWVTWDVTESISQQTKLKMDSRVSLPLELAVAAGNPCRCESFSAQSDLAGWSVLMDGYPHTRMMAVPCQWWSAIFGSRPSPKKKKKGMYMTSQKTCVASWREMMIFIFPWETWLHLTNYWKDPWGLQVFIILQEQDIHYKDLKVDNKFMLELYFLRCYQSSCHTPKNLCIAMEFTAGVYKIYVYVCIIFSKTNESGKERHAFCGVFTKTCGYPFAQECARWHKHTPPLDDMLFAPGFVDISPLNRPVSFDRGLFCLNWFQKREM